MNPRGADNLIITCVIELLVCERLGIDSRCSGDGTQVDSQYGIIVQLNLQILYIQDSEHVSDYDILTG